MLESEITNLPECVRKYLIDCGAAGQELINTVFLKQEGLFKVKDKWSKIKAQQFIDVPHGNFSWKAKFGPIRVTDEFIDGNGRLTIKLFGLIKLGQLTGKEIDQGEATRFLSEAIWYPTAFVSDFIHWKEIDDQQAEAVITYQRDQEAALQFSFNHQNEITEISGRRYMENDKRFTLQDWFITNLEYKEFNGIKIPFKAQVSWLIDNEIKPYYKLEITEIKYNS